MNALEQVCHDLLVAIGEDPTRDGLKDTPARFARWWDEFMNHDPGNTGTTFESERADQLVVVTGIRTWSLCEHHLLPFWCDVSIGYIADDKILGLSKFARITNRYSHRLQVQERLTRQIADEVSEKAGTGNVAVLAVGEHLCMAMRGVKAPHRMKSSVMRGVFRDDQRAREEFLLMCKQGES